MPAPTLPTLRAVDHVAYTVPDLDEAVRFFVDHFAAELVFTDGPFVDESGDGMRRRLDVDPRARCTIAMIRIGKHHNVELFEYSAPGQRIERPRNSDIGGHHLAFYVDDIEAAYDYVRAIPGVVVQEGPNGVDPAAPVAGQRWFYFQTPWGMQLELTTCATEGFYDGLPGAGMAPPSAQWR
ncbi:glyoxalase [Mycolicibacterium cosmeticum]|uniref:Lyase n=1 Tax=Mycolicibacterium cosmeticum TaxID=258533 RepID=W9B868_MYCCO|nr:VOC family protein [Mycolicibacterium cosmeticum]TLH74176.1 glyoxalase [Mycolicibacterium cosmeticum]CDO11132.1 putative lyase [Mycolicibacterium cosmeticum]